MFKAMRRMDRKMPDAEIAQILETANYGVLGLNLPNGYPYAVPVNFVYKENCLYIHCAGEGQKLDAIAYSNKSSFTIVNTERVVKSKFTSAYESVIAFGTVSRLEVGALQISVLKEFIDKYSDGYKEEGYAYVERAFANTTLLKLQIEQIEGKKNVKSEV